MRQTTPNILDAVLSGAGAAQPAATKVAIKNIINDGGTQMRASLNFETVSEYAEAMLAGVTFPPITLYYDGETYWLADGFHRLQAWKSIYQVAGSAGTYDPAEVPAIVHAGTRRDAILHAAGANANHGLRRTNEDKRRAVEVLLRDPEWSQWSDRVIAEACAVSHMFVSNLRKKMTVNGLQSPTERKGADGRTINTANIGASARQPERAEMFEIESVVRDVAGIHHTSAGDLRTIARSRIGAVWQDCLKKLPANLPYRELTQAMNNVASQMEAAAAGTNFQPSKPGPIAYSQYPAPVALPARRTLDTWIMQSIVETVRAKIYGDLDLKTESGLRMTARYLREDARNRSGLLWRECVERADAQGEWTHNTLVQALNNLANILEERAKAIAALPTAAPAEGDLHAGAGRTPPPPLTVAEVDGEPAQAEEPEAEPAAAEALPVSQRADYESDEWYTPREYIDAARAVMGGIDLDPATSEMAQTVVQATVYLTRFDDGLRQVRWLHQRIWLNPPYSNPAPWIEKLVREHQAGPFCTEAIVLVNNATETSWFQMLLERFPVCLPARRLAFWRHDHANVGARQGQAFFYLGPNVAKFQEVFSQFGPILRRMA